MKKGSSNELPFDYNPPQLTVPRAVSIAEIIEARICNDHLSVSFFVILSHLLSQLQALSSYLLLHRRQRCYRQCYRLDCRSLSLLKSHHRSRARLLRR